MNSLVVQSVTSLESGQPELDGGTLRLSRPPRYYGGIDWVAAHQLGHLHLPLLVTTNHYGGEYWVAAPQLGHVNVSPPATANALVQEYSHEIADTPLAGNTSRLSWSVNRDSSRIDHLTQLVAEWHGQVVSIEEDTFVAELRGTLGESVAKEHEEAVIPRAEVRRDDEELLEVGAFFRLCVVYDIAGNGNRRRYTDLIFRRIPAYRADEIQQAKERARDISRALRVE